MGFSRLIFLTGSSELYFSKMLIIFYYQGKKLSITEYASRSWKAVEPISFENLSEPRCMLRARPTQRDEIRARSGIQVPWLVRCLWQWHIC